MSKPITNRKSLRQLKLVQVAVAMLLVLGTQTVQANPAGGAVANGQASFVNIGNTLTVTNTPGTIINWQDFSIGANETTRFAQQSSSSAVLNRVVSNNPSNILGALQSNGRVYLINPNGIVFGAGSTVDVSGLVASTLNLSDTDFLAGRNSFTQALGAQNISNAGNLISHEGGQIYLIAPNVENTGIITAPHGEILLAAGASVELVNSSEPNLRVSITAPAGDATNVGQMIASAGSLGLFGTIVRNNGTVSADSAVMQGGKIVFKASQRAEISGTVTANGTTGGSIEVLGNQVGVMDGAIIKTDGVQGGGTVLIGGDTHGANPDVPNAQISYVAPTATISSDSSGIGNGGKVVVWADDATRFYGNISTRGGSHGGDGGFVETSGHNYLDFQGRVDMRAPNGRVGTLLLDPTNITIDNTTDNYGSGDFSSGVFSGGGDTSTITWNTIATQLDLGKLDIQTYSLSSINAGDININASAILTAPNTLTLLANNDIIFANGVSVSGSGDFNLLAGWNNSGLAVTNGNGNITFNAGSSLSTTGNIWLNAGNSVSGVGAAITANTLSLGNTNGGSLPGGVNLPGANMVNTLAIQIDSTTGSLTFSNGKALTIGSGPYFSGIVASNNTKQINITTTAGDLTIAQPVLSDGLGGGTITLTAASTLAINAAVTSTFNATPAGSVVLQAGSGGVVSDTNGIITAAVLASTSSGGTTLNGANVVSSFGATDTGAVSLTNTVAVLGLNAISSSSLAVNNTGSIVVNGPIDASGAGDAIVLNAVGNFTNTAGASALSAPNGRWLVYSADPAFNTLGGVTADFKRYNCTLSGNCLTPGTNIPATGNGLLYAIAPTLTINADGVNKVYGNSDPVLGYVATGFIDGDSTNATILNGSLARNAGENVGTYAINQGSLANKMGYGIIFTGNSLTINPATLTYTANAVSRLYGAADPAFSGNVTGFVLGQNQANATTGTLAFTTAAGATTNVGTAAINGSGLTANNGNYVFVQAAGNGSALTINPATLTYTANAVSRLYGAADPAFSGNVTGFVLGQNQANATTGTLAFTTAAGATTNVGTAAINGSGLTANNGNYVFVQAAGNGSALTINPATLTYTANAVSRLYGAADPAFSGNVTGFVLGQNQANATTGTLAFTTAAGATTNVGTAAINGSGLTANNGNYVFVQAAGNGSALTINPATLSVTANALSKVYGSADPALTYVATGLVGADTLSGALARVPGETVLGGPYAITKGTLANSNYTISYTGNNLTINPATLNVTANALSKVYGSTDPTLTYVATGFKFTDTAGSVLSGAMTRSSGETVLGGPYAITKGTLAANGNYTISYTGNNFNITPATLSVTANAASKVYGTVDPALTYVATGLVGADTLSGALARVSGETVLGGPYVITQGTLANSNYTISYTGNYLTINPAALSVTAVNATKTYNGSVYSGGNGVTYNGFVNNDNFSVLTGTLSYGGNSQGAINAGNYTITPTGLNSGNYTISYNNGVLTVNPAALSVTANAISKVYGAVDPALTYVATGLVGADTLSGALARVPGETVLGGPYAITKGTLANSNYTISYTGNNLTINPATLSVTANALSKVYGSADPALTYVATGLVGADTLSGALARVPGETVLGGPYAITKGTLANSNYTISYTGNNLTINPATLNVTANALSKVYGSTDPTLTYVATGFKFTDTAGSVLSGAMTRSSGETVLGGSYAITKGTLAANGNYTISYTGNNFSITPAALLVYANAASKLLNSADPPLTYTVSGFEFSDTAISTGLTVSLTRATGEVVGKYPISSVMSMQNSSNYTIGFVPANFIIQVPSVLNEIADTTVRFAPDTGSPHSTSSEDMEINETVAFVDTKPLDKTSALSLPMCR